MEKALITKKRENAIIIWYTKNTVYCSHGYNLAQKLDNSVQIVKINGHAWRRKIFSQAWGELYLAERLQGR